MKTQEVLPEYSKQADKYLSALDKKSEQKLKEAIEEIPNGNIKPYTGHPPYFRLVVRHNKVSYRVIFKWILDSKGKNQVYIAKIKPRGDVYKGA